IRIDRCEPLLGINVLDASSDVERIIVLLRLLIGIERLPLSECPPALALLAAGAGRARARPSVGSARGGPARGGGLGGSLGGHRVLVLMKQHEPVWQGQQEIARREWCGQSG